MIYISVYPAKRVNTVGNTMDMGGSMQISTLGGPGHVGVGGGGMPPVGGVGEVVVETMEVPDHCVGLGNTRMSSGCWPVIFFFLH